jgi:hypothetical protein
MNTPNKSFIPCFLCGGKCEIKLSKRGKPYFVCNPCGIQVFIRREAGIQLFNKAVNELGNSLFNWGKANPSFELIGMVNQLVQLRAKLMEIEEEKGIFDFVSADKELELATQALKQEIVKTEKKLKSHIEAR